MIREDDANFEIAAGLFETFDQRLDVLLARVDSLERADWDESAHPRGQPQNKGQFVKKAEQAEGMTVGRAGEGQYVAQVNGQYAAHAAVTPGQPFLSSLHVHDDHKGKGIGHALHEHIEDQIGRKLVPNPLHMDKDQQEWWKKRLAEMPRDEAKALLTEARDIGSKKFGRKQTDIDKLHMPLREVVGGGQHPGAGYSEQSYVDGSGRIHTSNVEDAARALYEKREVVLSQPREVATLIDHLGKVSAQMIAMGGKAPVFDLCKVSVAGTNLFCAESKGIPRVKMPQLDREKTKQFRHYLEAKGYKITREKEEADKLRATQDELNGAKVAANAAAYDAGKEARRIIVSKDNYILDGHHKWAATLGRDARDNKLGDTKMKISRVNASITDLLKETEEFGASTGASVASGTPAQPKDGEGEVKKGTKGYEFVSPNEKDLKFEEAIKSLEGERHKYIAAMAEDVDKELGLKGKVKQVVGVWADGAENSTMTVVKNPTWEKLVASAAMKGHLANQKQVLVYNEGDEDATHGDASFLASFEVKGDLKEVSNYLGQNGLVYHTLEPTKHGAIVHVYGSDDDTMFAVAQAGGHYGSEVEASYGRGAFLGTQKQDGTDDEQREDARAAYEREIEGSGHKSARAVWARLRDRYGRQGKASGQQVARGDAALVVGQRPKRMLVITRADYNPNQPRIPKGEPGGGQWSKGEGGGLGFSESKQVGDTKVWEHTSGNKLAISNTGKWRYFSEEDGESKTISSGGDEESLNKFLHEHKDELKPEGEAEPEKPDEHLAPPEVIDVGGDEWNQKTARQLAEAFAGAAPALDQIVKARIESGELEAPKQTDDDEEEETKFIPEEWDQLSDEQKDDAKNKWIEANKDDYVQSEIDNWHDNGDALAAAKSDLANSITNGDQDSAFFEEAIEEWVNDWNEEHPEDPVRYSAHDIFLATEVKDGSKYGDWGAGSSSPADPDIDVVASLDPLKTPIDWVEPDADQPLLPGFQPPEKPAPGSLFSDDQQQALIEHLTDVFNKEAEKKEGDMEAPSYLADSAEEYMDEAWDSNDDDWKWQQAKSYLDSDVFEEDEPIKKDADTGDDDTISEPPSHYDPLNESSGTDYRRTQAIARTMSIDRATDLMFERGLAGGSDRDVIRDLVKKHDDETWANWVSSSTSANGKLIQLAAADELGSRLRLPEKPKLDVPEIAPTTDKDIVDYYSAHDNKDTRWRRIQGRLNKAMFNTLDELKVGGELRDTIVTNMVKGGKLTAGEDGTMNFTPGPAKVYDLMMGGATGTLSDEDKASIRKIADGIEDKISKQLIDNASFLKASIAGEMTDLKESLDIKRKEEAEAQAKLKWAGYTPFDNQKMADYFKAMPSATPYKMNSAVEQWIVDKDVPSGQMQSNTLASFLARAALRDVKIEDGKPKFDLGDLSKLGDDYAGSELESRKEGLYEALAKGFEEERQQRDALAKQDAEQKYDNAGQYAWESREDLINLANSMHKEIGGYEGFKALMRAKWETSQWLLEKAGIKELNLYRGMDVPSIKGTREEVVKGPNGISYRKLPDANLVRAGAQSTSLKSSVSNGWDGGDRVVLRMTVPRTAVLSLPAYGKNVHSEREVVVMGTAWKNWDAYRGQAPEFDVVPLGVQQHSGPESQSQTGQ